MKTRRDFLKNTCTTCLGSVLFGWSLSACSSLPIYKTSASKGKLTVPVTSFEGSKLLVVRDGQLPYDILIVRKPNEGFEALYLKCTHQSNPLTVTGSGLHCPVHGSAFDLDGHVEHGPATSDLKTFDTSVENQQIIINLKS